MRYQKVKKSLNKLDTISDHFNSVILAAQDPIFENNIITSDQNNATINNSKSIPAVFINNHMILLTIVGLILYLKLSTFKICRILFDEYYKRSYSDTNSGTL